MTIYYDVGRFIRDKREKIFEKKHIYKHEVCDKTVTQKGKSKEENRKKEKVILQKLSLRKRVQQNEQDKDF